ncbi:MAG: hypothetical protein IJ111_05720 [Eggerthellaceae bacterium]|nr:hypothetical protein [Eggerthellaceae bacterium]
MSSRREEIQDRLAIIDQIARQNSYKYEKYLRGEFPEEKWAKFIQSQNEMYEERAQLEEELEGLDE